MKRSLLSCSLAILGGGILLTPLATRAANVGYYEMCSGGQGASWQASIISAAGHTPVLITTPDAASLNGLSALFVTNCDNDVYGAEYTSNLSVINDAVTSHGLLLIMHDRQVTNAAGLLPAAGSISFTREFSSGGGDINFPTGSPVLSGPGGALNDASVDGYTYSSHGYITVSSLPAGSAVYAVRADTSRATLVNYPAGVGRVVYSTSPLDAFYNTGNWNAYAVNLLAGLSYPAPISLATQTCASSGYTGTKLTWCKNICEMGYTGATLDIWIHRWINKYRDLPYCMQEETPPPPPPQQPA